MALFRKAVEHLAAGLAKTRQRLVGSLRALLAGRTIDEDLLDELEAQLILADVGVAAAGKIRQDLAAAYQQRQIQDAAYRVQREIEASDRIVVGVNKFTDDEAVTPPLQRIDPALEREQVSRLRAVRAERDEAAWAAALDGLEAIARGSDNIVPAMIEAVKARATLGEISDRLRAVWGEHREVVTV